MSPDKSTDVAIIGGGIVGTSTAYFLARKGVDCIVIERGEIGGEATTAAAGVLSHPNFLSDNSELSSSNSHSYLAKKSYEFYPDFIDEMQDYAKSSLGYEVCGSLYVAYDDQGETELKSYVTEMNKYGRSVEWLDRSNIQQRFPYVNESVQAGYLYTEEGKVNPIALRDAIVRAAREEGVRILKDCPASKIRPNDSTVEAIETEQGTVGAKRVLLSAGAWSCKFEGDLGVEIPIQPRKGVMVQLKSDKFQEVPMVWHGERFVMSRDDYLILGSTLHDTGFEKSCGLGTIADLVNSGLRLIPELESEELDDYWAGLRPYANRKGGPFLGEIPGWENAYIAAGHYKTGILQGPFTGKVMAQLIVGEDPELDLHPFRLNR